MPQDQPIVLVSEEYRVRMADVDAACVLYYASPYRWLEGLFTGWLADGGQPMSRVLASGSGMPCVASSARYLQPLRLDDRITLTLFADRVGKTSCTFRMEGRTADGELAVEASMTTVAAEVGEDGSMTKAPLPAWIQALLAQAKG